MIELRTLLLGGGDKLQRGVYFELISSFYCELSIELFV